MLVEVLLLLAVSFAAPVIYLTIIRNSEKYEREKWSSLIAAFLWGAIPAVLLSIIVEIPFGATLIAAVVAAPFIEELFKPMGILTRVKGEVDEVEDGIVFGVACAMGFAGVENVLYVLGAWLDYGEATAIGTAMARSLSSVLLHASATAFAGYGISRAIVLKKPLISAVPYYLLAVFIHGVFNLTVAIGAREGYLQELLELSPEQATFVVLLAMVFAITCFSIVYAMVRRLEVPLKI
jgi:RsiW-degrading membrane proteinase PrsW (M82 family)